jgi:hypothetical protein
MLGEINIEATRKTEQRGKEKGTTRKHTSRSIMLANFKVPQEVTAHVQSILYKGDVQCHHLGPLGQSPDAKGDRTQVWSRKLDADDAECQISYGCTWSLLLPRVQVVKVPPVC